MLNKHIDNPIWLSVSEAAKIIGVQAKTIRRALQSKKIRYKIIKNRYSIDFKSVILFAFNSSKLKNKLNKNGIGQYIKKWTK